MSKTFKEIRKGLQEAIELQEAKKPCCIYDVTDFPEDGLDDLMDHLGRISRAKQGIDWDLHPTRKGETHLELYTPKGKKAAEKFFGKNAPEKIK
jgi:hypothetical protein